ncbi:unnamed protein product, partial [Mesorhabditis spiculigera]
MEINNNLVFESQHYMYKAYLETLLNHATDYKQGFLSAAGYYEDDDSGNNQKANTVDICAPLHIDHFNSDRLFLPHLNIQLHMYRNKDTFVLESYETTSADYLAHVSVLDMKLHVKAIDISMWDIDMWDGVEESRHTFKLLPGTRRSAPYQTPHEAPHGFTIPLDGFVKTVIGARRLCWYPEDYKSYMHLEKPDIDLLRELIVGRAIFLKTVPGKTGHLQTDEWQRVVNPMLKCLATDALYIDDGVKTTDVASYALLNYGPGAPLPPHILRAQGLHMV